jgi:hypothetical protein
MMTVKFADEIARLKSTAEWKSADRHAVSLVKDDALNVLLMVLKKGAHLHEHRTKGPITVQLQMIIRLSDRTENPVGLGPSLQSSTSVHSGKSPPLNSSHNRFQTRSSSTPSTLCETQLPWAYQCDR